MRILLSIILILISISAEAATLFSLNESGKLPSGTKYSLSVKETPFQRTTKTEPDDGSMWGIDGGFPTYIVQKVSLRLNGKEVLIPRKFLTDICNINKATIREEKKIITLTIKGGDAAGSFVAIYKFKNEELIERLVKVSEMPDEIWEKTILHRDFQNMD